jgi:L-threonylcarbamoyladenylate synthase
MKSPVELKSARLLGPELNSALDILEAGGVVGLPTETVYGLAARIDRPEGLRLIFRTKQRPLFDPLIIHVSSLSQARDLSVSWSPTADYLARRFWPGPLTLVVNRSQLVDPIVSAGLDTVALRSPDHPVAQAVIAGAGPLAAPSANRFGHTSPTSAAHVQSEFPEVFCLDGGPCQMGVESTVVDVTNPQEVVLLRPGMVSFRSLEAALERISPMPKLRVRQANEATPPTGSPGLLAHHYEPSIPLVLLPSGITDRLSHDLEARIRKLAPDTEPSQWARLNLASEVALAARELYARMRDAESSGKRLILCAWPEDADKPNSDWAAIGDRLRRASRHHLL